MSDGRLLLNWSCYRDANSAAPWREAFYALSADHGHTWSAPRRYPIEERTNYTCMRHSVVELSPNQWICPFYDRTVLYDAETDVITPFGDGRNHGMVPIVHTPTGTLISGAPQAHAPVPVGVPGDAVLLREMGEKFESGELTDAADPRCAHLEVYDWANLLTRWMRQGRSSGTRRESEPFRFAVSGERAKLREAAKQ